MAKVLIIGDTHCPAMHPKYLPFLKRVYREHGCNRVVHIGDLVDWHAISFHEKDPSMPAPRDEIIKALEQVNKIKRAFPRVDYLMGNHSSLPLRKARMIGLPDEVMLPFETLWGLPNWKIHRRYAKLIIDGVQYRHGDSGKGGQFAASAQAKAEFQSVVQGDKHAQGGVVYHSNEGGRVFGLQVGCGVDPEHKAMNYARIYASKPVLGCGVVINGKEGHFIPMH
tara:strand:+ start:85 stop:756 length:672 start_codon:yes stop_codon:yes gene_type:complete